MQLAEEVIRLREEINHLKWYCLDGVQVAETEARLAEQAQEAEKENQ